MRILALILALFLALPASAMDVQKPTTDLTGVPSGKYVLDPTHTNVVFRISHLGYSGYIGRFNKISGTLTFDSAQVEKSALNVAIDPKSIDVNHEKLEGELIGPQVLDTGNFPDIKFVTTSAEKISDSTGRIMGNLTLHGVTKPIMLEVTFNGAGKNPMSNKAMLGFSATGKIQRSDFGIVAWAPMIGDDIDITIETEFQFGEEKSL